ncbi:MAG: type II toxin-antitoxin system VapC family toxin, partial [Okeania sp. SIO3B3]|nr:type II toxin-antitoxin system VapC family toxin [Okeania sp. SIO3B3]
TAKDEYHKTVQHHWNKLLATQNYHLITTSFVLDELAAYFSKQHLRATAVQWGDWLLNSEAIDFVDVDSSLLREGWDLYKNRSNDKEYSLTDCISFVVMRQQGIWVALTLDSHFEQAEFLCEPQLDK